MKRNILISLIIIAVLIVVDYFATKNIGGATVAAHNREFMSDWFTGSAGDWIGLGLFNIIWIGAIVAAFSKKDFYMPVGSSGISILIFFGGSLFSLALIYLL